MELDRRVLLIDADPSGNTALGFFPRGAPAVGLADALLDNLQLDEVALPSDYPGLGDSAFKFSLGRLNGVSTLGKNTVLLVQAEASHDKLAQLARLVLQRL